MSRPGLHMDGGRYSAKVWFRVLGDVCAEQDGIPVPLGRRQERRLLGLLLTEVGRAVPTERLADLLWDGEPPVRARNVIQTYVGRLRSVLLPFDVHIRTTSGGYRVDVPAEDVDLHRFQVYVASARTVAEPAERAEILAAAMDLWHGPLLGDVATERLRSRLGAAFEELRLTALEQYAEAELACGHCAQAIALLANVATIHPVRERLVGLLMQAYADAGRKSEALAVYREARQTLVNELGLEPGAYLRQRHEQMLRGDDPKVGRALDAARASESLPFRPFQLPADLPDFVGRQEATRTLVAALSGPPVGAYPAVASISGMPGTGKSALAIHAAHRLREYYPDGQIYLDLAGDDIGTVEADDALGQMLVGLGFTQATLPPTSGERSAVLRSLCAERRLLLVLDNARTGDHVLPLFPANPRCGVLVTSRMHLGGLSAWPHVEVPQLDAEDALELLARIIGRPRVNTEPDAAARVAELCAGLPLAIRIAGTRLAARSHHGLGWLVTRLETEQTRLDELSTTGAALRSSFDISYRGLDETLQHALCQLGLLDVPDFGAWLAAATLDCSLREAEECIDGLVEARLLGLAAAGAVDVTRFRFHQLIRLYAREMAVHVESPESRSAVLARGYGACLTLAERLDQRLRRHTKLVSSGRPRSPINELVEPSDSVDPTISLVAERGTLVAAVHACAGLGWSDLAWDLGLTLQRFLESQHHFHDWLEVATAGLGAARASGDRHAEAAVLCSLGELHAVQDHYVAATEAFQHALTVARGGGHDRVEARALLGLSVTHTAGGKLDDSVRLAREALRLVDDRLDPGTAAETWMSLGTAQYQQRELSAAEVSFRHALDGFVATGDRLNQAILLVNMGTTLQASERWAEAERAYNRSAEICREIGFRNGEGFVYRALGSMLLRTGETDRAEQTLTAALTIVHDYADQLTEGIVLNKLGELFRSTDLDRSRQYFDEAVELLGDSELPTLLADALTGLGDTELLAGEPARARKAWARARDVIEPNDADRAASLRRRLAEPPTPRTTDSRTQDR